ncbi:MAG: demethylmenaquinone methyltransferase [Bacillota bacterium]
MNNTCQDKSDYVHHIFESIAQNYDSMNRIISLGLDSCWRKKTAELIDIKPGAKILDVACGTCDWTIMLAEKLGEQGQVVGLDFSSSMLEHGTEKIAARELDDQIDLMEGDASELPFSNNQFDSVTIGFALRNISGMKEVLSEMRRVVKPGGTVISLDIFEPTLPVYRQLFLFYFRKIVPLIGQLAVNKYQEYNWLPQSVKRFVTIAELKNMFKEFGFTDIQVTKLMGGAVAMHRGIAKKQV